MSRDLSGLRREYRRDKLSRDAMHADPLQQCQQWFDDCERAGFAEWNAFTLATVSAEGRAAARIVLLKGLEQGGFVFFTNYHSRKGREIAANPEVALTAWWLPLERQLRIEGRAAPISSADSDKYFQSRPRGSRLGAHASEQSCEIGAYHELEERLAALTAQYPDDEPIPRPAHWGGYCVTPRLIEFWQGRPSRLHDRILYEAQPKGAWRITRLAP